jgi:hypothetical protein
MVSQILDLAGKEGQTREYKRGKYQCTVDLLGISCMTTDNFFFLQNILIQTSQTGGQWYSDTSPFSIPWTNTKAYLASVDDEEKSYKTLTLPDGHQP